MKLVIHNGSRVWGGNEKWLTMLAVALRDRGHHIVVSCRPGGPLQEQLRRQNIPTSSTRPGGDIDVLAALRFARWLRTERPDALLLTSWNRTPWGVWAARRARVPRVIVRLGIVRALPRRGRYTRAFRKGVDALIVNSADVKAAWLRSAPWFDADAVHVVHNAIVLPEAADHRGDDDLRRALGLHPDTPLLAAAGHLTRRKGFDILLNAFARIERQDAHLVVIGGGAEEQLLRALARALDIAPRVHWLGHRADASRLLGQTDVFVLSSRTEGMANVMLEAMAAGVPVVATAISGVQQALGAVNGRPPAGWIVPPDDPAAMAGAIQQILTALRSEREEVHRRVREARYRIQHWFTVSRMADEAARVIFHAAARP